MKRSYQIVSIILLLGLILGLIEAQFHPLRHLFGGRPLAHRELATDFLGRYLASQYAGKSVVVFSNPFTRQSGQPRQIYDFEEAGLRGLRRGLGTALKIEQVVFPEVKPEFVQNSRRVMIDPGTTTPLSYIVAEDSFDKLADQHPAAEVLVSLIGLPAKVVRTQSWQPNSLRKFALLLPDLRMVGNQAAIRQAIQSRKLAALVLNKPGAPPETQPLGKDLKMEFDQRFLLVTPETVDQYLRAYPRLF